MCAEAGCAASGARGVSKRLLVPTGVFTGFQLPCCNVFVSDGNSRTADAMISRGVADARGRSAESLQSRCRQSARPVSSLAPALLSPALLSPAPLFPTMTSPRRSPPFACLALSAALDAPSRHPAGVARSTGGSPGPPPPGWSQPPSVDQSEGGAASAACPGRSSHCPGSFLQSAGAGLRCGSNVWANPCYLIHQ